jgi:signal transduction histidine kinase
MTIRIEPDARVVGPWGRLSLEETLAVLVHGLRTPLGAIQCAVQALRLARGGDVVVDKTVGVVDRQVRQMGRLVGDLLDLTRLAAGKLELRLERLDLATAAGHAVEACRAAIDQHGHQLTVSLPPGPVWLHADPARLQQILVNLLSNSVKYTAPGGHIGLTAETEASLLVVRVRDDGMGIAADLLPHIFELFQQGPGLEGRRDGMGVGLALVRWLVELHGGRVAAHSDGPGKGAEFVVRLPTSADAAFPKGLLALAPPWRYQGCPGFDRAALH